MNTVLGADSSRTNNLIVQGEGLPSENRLLKLTGLYDKYGEAISLDYIRSEAKLANQWRMWGNIGIQLSGNGYHNIEGCLGVKYTW